MCFGCLLKHCLGEVRTGGPLAAALAGVSLITVEWVFMLADRTAGADASAAEAADALSAAFWRGRMNRIRICTLLLIVIP